MPDRERRFNVVRTNADHPENCSRKKPDEQTAPTSRQVDQTTATH